jgi:hypothetical protein
LFTTLKTEKLRDSEIVLMCRDRLPKINYSSSGRGLRLRRMKKRKCSLLFLLLSEVLLPVELRIEWHLIEFMGSDPPSLRASR